ncbi:MAG: universal stress protein [Magnetococcus sp. XQGC-1]
MAHHRYFRILAVIDPLPSGEPLVRQLSTLIRGYAPRDLLWVTLCDDIGMGFESGHAPFMTPLEWLQRTEKDLSLRLSALLRQLGIAPSEFRLLPGQPNRTLATLADDWCADLILSKASAVDRISGRDCPEWWRRPAPLPCTLQTVPTLSPWQKEVQAFLESWKSHLRPIFSPGKK